MGLASASRTSRSRELVRVLRLHGIELPTASHGRAGPPRERAALHTSGARSALRSGDFLEEMRGVDLKCGSARELRLLPRHCCPKTRCRPRSGRSACSDRCPRLSARAVLSSGESAARLPQIVDRHAACLRDRGDE